MLFEHLYYDPAQRTLVLYRVYEVDEKVYLVHTRNKTTYYGRFIENEFYLSNNTGVWIAEPEQDRQLINELAERIKAL